MDSMLLGVRMIPAAGARPSSEDPTSRKQLIQISAMRARFGLAKTIALYRLLLPRYFSNYHNVRLRVPIETTYRRDSQWNE